MQTGTMCDRYRRLLSLVLAVVAAAGPAGTCRGQTSWEQGIGGTAVPRHLCLQGGMADTCRICAGASAGQPWGLPGMFQAVVEVFFKSNYKIVRCKWDRLACAICADDRVEGSVGISTPGLPLRVHLIGGCRRLSAEGFAPAVSFEGGWAVAAGPLAALTIEAGRLSPLRGSSDHALPGACEGWLLSAIAGRGAFRFVASVHRPPAGKTSLRIGMLVGRPGGARFAFGARPGTGEISGGLHCGGAVSAAVAWRMHPILGGSMSFGVGAALR